MPKPDPAKLRRSATCAIVFDSAGKLLLHRRTDNNRWALPGGAIETGETAAETIVREVREETGFEVEMMRITGIYSDPKETTISYPNGDVAAYVAIAFECRVTGGAPALSDETSEVGWFSVDALPENFHPPHLPRVRDALARQPAAFAR